MSEKENTRKDPIISPNLLADFFYWVYKTILAADKPFQMIIVLFLPILAPIPPANIIKKSLIKHMGFELQEANIAAIVLIMLGYAGVIAYVRSFVKSRKDPGNKILKEEKTLYAIAWGIYLIAITVISVALEIRDGADFVRVLVLISLTLGTEIAAGILNASRISDRDEKESALEKIASDREWELIQKKQKDETSLKRTALKQGFNVLAQDTAQVAQTGAQDDSLSIRDAQQIDRFRNKLGVSGNWRVDGKKMTKDDLQWLKVADIPVIMRAGGIEKRTAQGWKKSARDILAGK